MKKDINIGGINGLGESLVNTNSQEFLELRNMIKKHYKNSAQEEQIENGLLSIRFQMESYLNSIEHDEMVIPGEFIEKFLTIVNVKKKRFSHYIGYEYTNLIALIKGRRRINSDLAIKLGQIFKVEPVMWLHIESKNELIRELKKEEGKKRNFSLIELLNAG